MKLSSILCAFVSIVTITNAALAANASEINVTPNEVTDYIINKINKYRESQGLPPVQVSDETCNFAKIRALEIADNYSHDGFNKRITNGTLPYESWSNATENIAIAPDYKQVEAIWEHSSGHAENMRADTPYVCVIRNGKYFAYVGMRK